jgi:natural resistance-associated macrophage protein
MLKVHPGIVILGFLKLERFGYSAQLVWAIGLLASGQSSTMAGTFASQFVLQGFLDWNIPAWLRTLLTRSLAIVPTVIVAILFTSDLDKLDQFLNILQSINLPFALLPLLTFCSSRALLGDYALSKHSQFVFWIAVCSIVSINMYMIGSRIADSHELMTVCIYCLISICAIAYFSLIIYLARFKGVSKPEMQKIQVDDVVKR